VKKQVWFILTALVLVLVFAIGCSCGQKANIGEVSKDKDDEAAIKEVVEAYYAEAKNFKWDNFDPEAGLEFWTAEGREQYLAEEAESLAESVERQKLSSQLKGIEFQDINIEDKKAVVSLVSQEECASKVTEGLNGLFQGYGTLELQKSEQTWQIENYDFHLVKIEKQ
jgi:hypothetical protein